MTIENGVLFALISNRAAKLGDCTKGNRQGRTPRFNPLAVLRFTHANEG
jgi:hypothetical protein